MRWNPIRRRLRTAHSPAGQTATGARKRRASVLWLEQLEDNRIYRPSQIYTGTHNEPYVPIEERV